MCERGPRSDEVDDAGEEFGGKRVDWGGCSGGERGHRVKGEVWDVEGALQLRRGRRVEVRVVRSVWQKGNLEAQLKRSSLPPASTDRRHCYPYATGQNAPLSITPPTSEAKPPSRLSGSRHGRSSCYSAKTTARFAPPPLLRLGSARRYIRGQAKRCRGGQTQGGRPKKGQKSALASPGPGLSSPTPLHLNADSSHPALGN
jgi:hypothetical protein